MKNYPYALAALGLLFYPLQQALFYLRFGHLNTTVSDIDALLPLVGVGAFIILIAFLNHAKTAMGRTLYWTIFVTVGIPLSLVGSVGGGLLGPFGAIAFGLMPVFVILLLAKGILLLLQK